MATSQILVTAVFAITSFTATGASAQSKEKLPSHTITIQVEGTPNEFWQYFEPVKLEAIFKSKGKIPGVKGTSAYSDWHTPGNKRTIQI